MPHGVQNHSYHDNGKNNFCFFKQSIWCSPTMWGNNEIPCSHFNLLLKIKPTDTHYFVRRRSFVIVFQCITSHTEVKPAGDDSPCSCLFLSKVSFDHRASLKPFSVNSNCVVLRHDLIVWCLNLLLCMCSPTF